MHNTHRWYDISYLLYSLRETDWQSIFPFTIPSNSDVPPSSSPSPLLILTATMAVMAGLSLLPSSILFPSQEDFISDSKWPFSIRWLKFCKVSSWLLSSGENYSLSSSQWIDYSVDITCPSPSHSNVLYGHHLQVRTEKMGNWSDAMREERKEERKGRKSGTGKKERKRKRHELWTVHSRMKEIRFGYSINSFLASLFIGAAIGAWIGASLTNRKGAATTVIVAAIVCVLIQTPFD